jgi:ribonuclease D
VLEGPGTAVVHAATQDLEVLQRACGAVPSRLFDTQLAAGFLGMSSPSLVSLVERTLGIRLPKGDRLTDWSRRPLTAGQQEYAASDVLHLLELHDRVTAELTQQGRLEWAEQECARLLARTRQPQEPETAWWRVKENRQLRGSSRGVAQELAAWRERRAASLDIPPRMVLPDLALVAISHRPPRSRDDLLGVRGLDARHLKGGAEGEILAAIERGASLPEAALRLPDVEEVDRALRPAVALVSAWIAQLAHDLKIDAALLATRSDLQSFLQDDPDARLANGWRHQLVGEPVRRLVQGEAALAFAGGGQLVLEQRSRIPAGPTS